MHSDNKPLFSLTISAYCYVNYWNKDFKTAKRYYKAVDTLKADEMSKVFG